MIPKRWHLYTIEYVKNALTRFKFFLPHSDSPIV